MHFLVELASLDNRREKSCKIDYFQVAVIYQNIVLNWLEGNVKGENV